MKKQIIRAAASAVLGLSLTTGFAAAQSGSIDTTGPFSNNHVTVRSTNTARIRNNNNLRVSNQNRQTATTGNARVNDNTIAGDASSGDASNDNSSDTSVTVNNSSGLSGLASFSSGDPSGSISTTGPHSNNDVTATTTNKLTVTNNNNLTVTNNSTQSAKSGNATVSDNTEGGSASTGSASNTNSTSTTVDVSN